MAYHVQFYSKHYERWMDYVAPTFNTKPTTHESEAEAKQRLTRLQGEWPHNEFRVISDEALEAE